MMIDEAFRVLSDNDRRRRFDMTGAFERGGATAASRESTASAGGSGTFPFSAHSAGTRRRAGGFDPHMYNGANFNFANMNPHDLFTFMMYGPFEGAQRRPGSMHTQFFNVRGDNFPGMFSHPDRGRARARDGGAAAAGPQGPIEKIWSAVATVLPIIFIFLFLLSNLTTNHANASYTAPPDFTYRQADTHPTPRVTANMAVPYFVSAASFDPRFPASSNALKVLEHTIEREYVRSFFDACKAEYDIRQRLLRHATLNGSEADRKVAEARPTYSCDIYWALKSGKLVTDISDLLARRQAALEAEPAAIRARIPAAPPIKPPRPGARS
ncbi:hypothetical protein, variant [Fonticula alba]|nr:hypothetical protein, variant [Fonticula alba]KCV67507.1 hypothetical protein, variant [Fonticula alba]|eukprot:XP_009498068.1 hypothetical protein, variant [Fonticula alba]